MVDSRSISGSSAERSIMCPGWRREARGMPESGSSYAREGTALHVVTLEECIVGGADPRSFVGEVVKGVEITKEHIRDTVEPAIDALDAIAGEVFGDADYTLAVEQTFGLQDVVPDCDHTTVDLMAWAGDVLVVADLKTGRGVSHHARESYQLGFYALGAEKVLRNLGVVGSPRRIVFAIIQPSDGEDAPDYSTWDVPDGWLHKYRVLLKQTYLRTQDSKAELVPGTWCKFCPGQPRCSAYKTTAQALINVKPEGLTALEVSDLLREADLVEGQISALRRYAHAQMTAGVQVPGWKLVKKRGRRQHVLDEAELERRCEMLGIDAWQPRKVKSPAMLEADIGRRRFREMFPGATKKEDGGLAMVSASDPRPAVGGSVNRLAGARLRVVPKLNTKAK